MPSSVPSPQSSPYDGGHDATDTATDVARGTPDSDVGERNLAPDGGAPRDVSSARSDERGHDSSDADVQARDAASPSDQLLAAFKAWALADSDQRSDWIIERATARRLFEQLGAQRSVLEKIVREADSSLEVLPPTNTDTAYFDGRREAALEALAASNPASRQDV